MIRTKHLAVIALASLVSAAAVSSASAQNPGFDYTDLFLGFQSSGANNDNYIIASLGDSTTYRDLSVNTYNITNVNSALTAQFGAGWADRTDLFVGAAGSFSNDEFSDLHNGDAPLTTYVSAARQTIGTLGAAGSFAYSVPGASQDIANNIQAAQNIIEAQGLGAISTISSGTSFNDYNDQNSFSGSNQNVAWGTFSGGTQYKLGAGNLGNLGPDVGTVEAALDLYRIDPTGESTYEGTIVINSLGDVSYLVAPVPEPSTALGLGLLVGMVGLVKRRRTVVA